MMVLYEYVDGRGRGVIRRWIEEELEQEQWHRLRVKLDLLAEVDLRTAMLLLSGTGDGNIFKLRVKGRVQLRPMLCYGPPDPTRELTFLLPAVERNGKLEPRDAVARALSRRQEVIDDNNKRQILEYPPKKAN
jgi:hypothetical protein